jgi:serine/threonine protein phosphatase PrpC
MAAPNPDQCPKCATPVGPADSFCEVCGCELGITAVSEGSPAVADNCGTCGSSQLSDDGYCEQCGRKAAAGRDHVELDLGVLAGVTDRGHKHSRNEDAMALSVARIQAGLAAIAIVCDGVSTSDRPDEASLAAADRAVRVLARELRAGGTEEAALLAAAQAARTAVTELAGSSENAPAATYVSAVVTASAVSTCWLGDSRVYWLPAGQGSDPVLLTTDDSVSTELVASGRATEAEAIASPYGHVITRWLGADADSDPAHTARFEPAGSGVVLVCSDGLWNYQPDAAGLAALAMPRALTDPPGAAADLLAFALASGGHDNITVVLVPYPPRDPAAPAGDLAVPGGDPAEAAAHAPPTQPNLRLKPHPVASAQPVPPDHPTLPRSEPG